MQEEASTTSLYSLQVLVDYQQPTSAYTVHDNILHLHHPHQQQIDKQFKFETILTLKHKNQQLHQKYVASLIGKIFGGQNGLIIGYRTTSNGAKLIRTPTIEESNITPIFSMLEGKLKEHPEMKLKLNFYQVYNSKIIDLLSQWKPDLKIRQSKEQGIRIDGITEPIITNLQQFMHYYKLGLTNSQIYHTMMSSYDSGTHICMSFIIHMEEHKYAQLNIVELGMRSKNIGYHDGTICAVLNVLDSMTTSKFIPYRDSVITRVNARAFKNTVVILHLEPSMEEYSQNLSGLRSVKKFYEEVAPPE